MNKGPLASEWEAKWVGENQSSKTFLLRPASLWSPKPRPVWSPNQSMKRTGPLQGHFSELATTPPGVAYRCLVRWQQKIASQMFLHDPWFWAFVAVLGWFQGLLAVASDRFGSRLWFGVICLILVEAPRIILP